MRGPARPIALVFATALVAGLGLPSNVAAEEDKPGPCAITRAEDQTVRRWVKDLIRCAEDRWPVPGGAEKAICIADAESGLDPKAVSEDGTYVGLYQHLAEAWPDRYRDWTRQEWELDDRPLNGRTNTIVTIRMVNTNGWGAWAGVGDC